MLLQSFSPWLSLQLYIHDIMVQEDFSPVNYANINPVKVLPTIMTVIGIQYGQPMKRWKNNEAIEMGSSGITGLQTNVMEYVSTGAIGTIIVQFKPGGLSHFTRYPLHEFHNANVPLELVFPPRMVRDMEEKLAAAHGAADRVGIGKRNLERKFNSLIGVSPKQFTRIVRFQHLLELRHSGYDYLDIVYACGYADHAHLAKDFKAFTGCSPEQFFRSEVQPELMKSFSNNDVNSLLNQQLYC